MTRAVRWRMSASTRALVDRALRIKSEHPQRSGELLAKAIRELVPEGRNHEDARKCMAGLMAMAIDSLGRARLRELLSMEVVS